MWIRFAGLHPGAPHMCCGAAAGRVCVRGELPAAGGAGRPQSGDPGQTALAAGTAVGACGSPLRSGQLAGGFKQKDLALVPTGPN